MLCWLASWLAITALLVAYAGNDVNLSWLWLLPMLAMLPGYGGYAGLQ